MRKNATSGGALYALWRGPLIRLRHLLPQKRGRRGFHLTLMQPQRRVSEQDERPLHVPILGGLFGFEDRVADGLRGAKDLAIELGVDEVLLVGGRQRGG